MKYKTFIAMVATAGVLVGAGLAYEIYSAVQEHQAERRQQVLDLYEQHQDADAVRRERGSADPSDPLAVEPQLRALLGQGAGAQTKRKDLFGGRGPKINVYAEDQVWVRAKVDLDRDEKWDEKWRWEAGVLYRKVAANDDEDYGVELALDGPGAAGEAEPPGEQAPAVASDELRDVDRLMLELLELPAQAKIKDASKGRPFKINLYSDDGQRFNRAKVDLDRDDKWDEKWDFGDGGAVERQVSVADDEQYGERYVLEAKVRWQAVAQ